MSDQRKRGRQGSGSSGSGSDSGGARDDGLGRVRILHGNGHLHREDLFDERTFVHAAADPARLSAGVATAPTERRDSARRRLARAVRSAARVRPGGLGGLPAAAAYGRFPDLAAVDAAAGALGADPHAWHRLHLATLPPEGLERDLARLVVTGDRACAVAGVRLLAQSLSLSGAGDRLARVRYWLAVLSAPARTAAAVRRLRQALPPAVRHGDRERVSRILGQLGRLYAIRGLYPEAYARLRAGLDLAAGLGLEPTIHAAMHINLGNVLGRMGHADRAERAYQQGLDLALQGGQEGVAMLARDGLRLAEEQRGNFAQAYLCGSAVLAWQRRVGPPEKVRRRLVTLARIAHEMNPAGGDALALLAEAEGVDASAPEIARHQLTEAGVRAAHGEQARAVALIDAVDKAIPALPPADANTAAFHIAYLRAELLLQNGAVAGAYEWYRAAARALAAVPNRGSDILPHLRSALLASMAAAAQAVGRTEEAVALAADMARAYEPEPLPTAGTRDVIREELALVGEEPPSAGAVVFLSAGAARRGERR